MVELEPADSGAPDGDAALLDGASPPLLPGLVGRWLFDGDTGAIVKDSSGAGNDGTLLGGAITSGIGGVRGGALALDGSSGRMVVESLAGAGFPRTGTFAIWFICRSVPQPVAISLLDAYDEGRSHVFLRHRNGAPSTEFQFALQRGGTGGNGYSYVELFPVATARWTHVVATWDEGAALAALHRRRPRRERRVLRGLRPHRAALPDRPGSTVWSTRCSSSIGRSSDEARAVP